MASTTKVKVPIFDSVNKPYEMYVKEIKFWQKLSKVDKKEQAVLLAYNLPDEDPSGIKEKLFLELDLDELCADEGVATFLAYMNDIFLKDDLTKAYEDYVKFDTFRRENGTTIVAYINDFEKRYNAIKTDDCKLPQAILSFKLLDCAGISKQDRLFVLTGIDYSQKTTLFTQAKTALKKYAGEQVGGSSSDLIQSIKIEPTFNAVSTDEISHLEHTLNSHGFYRKKDKRHPDKFKKNFGSNQGTSSFKSSSYRKPRIEKPINPKGEDGEVILCPSCGSFRHMLDECPVSYENLQKQSKFSTPDNVVLFTKVGALAFEASNKAVIDTGCTSTVAGEEWLATFMDSLSDEEKSSVIKLPSEKHFKFGNGKILKSLFVAEFPCQLGNKKVRIRCDVVKSDIPLLLSADSLEKAHCILDLGNDRISLFDDWTVCDRTSSGLFVISLGKTESPLPVENVCVALEMEDSSACQKYLLKLHRQFGHTYKDRFCDLLKDAGKWKESYKDVINSIYDKCQTCAMHSKVAPRPICALPVATEFSEVLTLDLKECNSIVKNHKYILHMIDAFTRYSVSVFIERKLPEVIVENVFSCWISKYGSPKRIWTDLGGEFNNEEVKEMSEALGIELGSGGAFAGWMYGLNERNHQVIDFCLEKILHSDPSLKPSIALAWAVTAKNTLKMTNGFSAHQLVFGKNPPLPSVTSDKLPALSGSCTAKEVADHIVAMYEGRKAFVESEYSERICRALRHNIRSVENVYETGQKVYYHTGKKWRGPATVIGSDNCVVIVKHQSNAYRVAASRLKHVGEEFQGCASVGKHPSNSDTVESGKTTETDAVVESFSKDRHCYEKLIEDSTPNGNDNTSLGVINNSDDYVKPNYVPRKNDVIRFKTSIDSGWNEGTVISRAGKQTAKTGRNQLCVNVQPSDESDPICVNLKKGC